MNLISRFWNGDVSLPKSYWLIGVLLTIPISWVLMWIMPSQLILGAGLFVIWVGFCIVGIWRSSNKYEGKKVWAVLVKILLVLWILGTFSSIYAMKTIGSWLAM